MPTTASSPPPPREPKPPTEAAEELHLLGALAATGTQETAEVSGAADAGVGCASAPTGRR
ncbi:hypothetical protein [Streptomonospora arabica]|uniref:Uncharacterized protein n=1 Tax=Streptomonospora arabica TaxID=412417 RepID=A0ABV9SR03_9ACTN